MRKISARNAAPDTETVGSDRLPLPKRRTPYEGALTLA
jgi:hypothetical protein